MITPIINMSYIIHNLNVNRLDWPDPDHRMCVLIRLYWRHPWEILASRGETRSGVSGTCSRSISRYRRKGVRNMGQVIPVPYLLSKYWGCFNDECMMMFKPSDSIDINSTHLSPYGYSMQKKLIVYLSYRAQTI